MLLVSVFWIRFCKWLGVFALDQGPHVSGGVRF